MKPELKHMLIDPKMGSGAFLTPPAALEEIKKIMDATETVVETNKERGKNLVMPRGIVLQRFVASDRTVRYMGQYRNACPNASAADKPVRMYEIRVAKVSGVDVWCAFVYEDGKSLAHIETPFSRATAERMGLATLKAFLRYRDKRNASKARRRRNKKAEGGAK